MGPRVRRFDAPEIMLEPENMLEMFQIEQVGDNSGFHSEDNSGFHSENNQNISGTNSSNKTNSMD